MKISDLLLKRTLFQTLFIFPLVSNQCLCVFEERFSYLQKASFPVGSEVKVSACNVGDLGSIPSLGRSPGEGNGNPLQYSCLENPMDGGAWWATVHGAAKSWTRLSDFTYQSYKKVLFPPLGYRCKNHNTQAFYQHSDYHTISCALTHLCWTTNIQDRHMFIFTLNETKVK